MTPLQFEADHRPSWDELEAALTRLQIDRRRRNRKAAKAPATARAAAHAADPATPVPAAAPAIDAARLALLYRRACEHLALARSRAYPAHLVYRLEGLTQRAHQSIYRRSDYGLARLARLFLIDFPVAVRAHRRHVLIAALVFGLPLLLVGIATWHDPGFVLSMHNAAEVATYERMYGDAAARIGQANASQDAWLMFGYYILNNVSIAFKCFASGLLFGVGSLLMLAYNGFQGGSIAGYLTASDHAETFYSFVITHGAFELTAIVLSGAAGLRLGQALLAPGRRTRRAALEAAAAETAVLMYGVATMLFIAAVIEAFWSSSRWVEPSVKYGVGGICWALVIAYLVGQGRPRSARTAGASASPLAHAD